MAFDALPAPAFVVTADGVVKLANRAGRAWLDVDRAGRSAILRASLRPGGGPFRVDDVPLGPAAGALRLLVHDPSVNRPDDGTRLTARERDVLGLLAHGATYDEIARMLAITTNTVRSHVRSLYDKLDASSKTEAVREGLRRGYVALREAG